MLSKRLKVIKYIECGYGANYKAVMSLFSKNEIITTIPPVKRFSGSPFLINNKDVKE